MKSKNQQTNNTDAMAVVKATYTKSRGGAKAAIRYIQHRKDREGGKVTRELYGAAGVIKRQDAYQMIDDAAKGTVFSASSSALTSKQRTPQKTCTLRKSLHKQYWR